MQLSSGTSYIIIDSRELDLIDFDQFMESRDTVIYNHDGTKSLVKYIGSAPSYTFQYPTLGPYTMDGIKEAQDPAEWPDGLEEITT